MTQYHPYFTDEGIEAQNYSCPEAALGSETRQSDSGGSVLFITVLFLPLRSLVSLTAKMRDIIALAVPAYDCLTIIISQAAQHVGS